MMLIVRRGIALLLDFLLLSIFFFPITYWYSGKWIINPEDHLWGITDPICLVFLFIIFAYFTFLEAAKKTPYYVLFYEALFTGMRRSELLALRWCDVDLLLCQVYVTRSLHHLRTGEIVFRAPKTAKGCRMVSLSPSAALLLQEHRDKQEAQRAMLGIPLKDDDLIFSDLAGKPLLPNTVSHV